jgi:hypothetical protein
MIHYIGLVLAVSLLCIELSSTGFEHVSTHIAVCVTSGHENVEVCELQHFAR